MALHTLAELNSEVADSIRVLIDMGYKIDPIKSKSDNFRVFNAVLNRDNYTMEIHTSEEFDSFTKLYIYKFNSNTIKRESFTYYLAHDNVFADSIDESVEEYRRWLSALRRH